MTRQHSGTILLLALLSMAGCSRSDGHSRSDSDGASATEPVVRQIDHILIESIEANELFSMLTDTLQLPVAWAMADYGGFASGGVAVGNVNLEVLKAFEPSPGEATSRFTGFALEPGPLKSSLSELKARGIRHGRAAPFRSLGPNGSTTTLWTTVGLPSVSRDNVAVFLCAYEHDVAESRRQSLEQLRSRKGGPLSVRSVREIVYGTMDAPRMQRQWQALLNPAKASSPGVWPVGDGPAIRVIQAPESGIRGIVINVESLPQARQFLDQRGLLRTERSGEITLGSQEFDGLTLTLVQDNGD